MKVTVLLLFSLSSSSLHPLVVAGTCNDTNETDLRLGDGNGNCSGPVMMCWEGSWRGLDEDSVRTTRQANYICKHLEFSSEGAEILQPVTIEGDNIHCFWREGELDIENCTNETSEECCACHNKTAVIKCRHSMFTPELISLMVVVPVLLCVILIGIIIVIHHIRKTKRLNVIIHQLIYKQQKLKAGLTDASLDSAGYRSSMYAKPLPSRPTKTTANTSSGERGNSLKPGDQTSGDKTLVGPSQYSLLGNDKYENVDLKEIEAVQ